MENGTLPSQQKYNMKENNDLNQNPPQRQSKQNLEDNLGNTTKLLKSTDISANEEEIDFINEDQNFTSMSESEWLKILRNNDIENTSHAELEQSLRYGIPEDL